MAHKTWQLVKILNFLLFYPIFLYIMVFITMYMHDFLDIKMILQSNIFYISSPKSLLKQSNNLKIYTYASFNFTNLDWLTLSLSHFQCSFVTETYVFEVAGLATCFLSLFLLKCQLTLYTKVLATIKYIQFPKYTAVS